MAIIWLNRVSILSAIKSAKIMELFSLVASKAQRNFRGHANWNKLNFTLLLFSVMVFIINFYHSSE